MRDTARLPGGAGVIQEVIRVRRGGLPAAAAVSSRPLANILLLLM